MATGSGRIQVEVLQVAREGERALGSLSVSSLSRGDEVEVAFRVDGGGSLHVEIRYGQERLWRILPLEGEKEDRGEAFRRNRERLEHKLALLSGLLDAERQDRLRSLVGKIRLLPDDDEAVRSEAMEVLDHLAAALEGEDVS